MSINMDQKQIKILLKLSLVSAICLASSLSVLVSGDCDDYKRTQMKMTLYLHDYASGPNATFFPVVGLSGKVLNYTEFGTFFVTDDPITKDPRENSPVLGRAQGIYVVTGLDGKNLLVVLSLVFSDGAYSGSSIEIQGSSRQFDPARELPVIAGTGKFRFARGYSNSHVMSFDAARGYSLLQLNVTLIH